MTAYQKSINELTIEIYDKRNDKEAVKKLQKTLDVLKGKR